MVGRRRRGLDSSLARPRPDTTRSASRTTTSNCSRYGSGADPNHLLGKPNSYTSEATFTDNRISPADTAGVRPGSIQKGGSVEVFANASSATIRQQRLAQLEKNAPLLASEYTFTDGPALLRVSGRLTPAQAAEYATAFRS